MLLTLLIVAIGAKAADPVVVDDMQLGVQYDLSKFGSFTGTFTAPQSGVLTVDGGGDVEVFSDEAHQHVLAKQSIDYGANSGKVTYNVVENTTYYLYCRFVMNATYVKLTMGEGLAVESIDPAENTVFSLAGIGDVSIKMNQSFNSDYTVGLRFITAAGTVDATAAELAMIEDHSWGTTLSLRLKPVVLAALRAGKIAQGDHFQLVVNNLKDGSGKAYNNGEPLTVSYEVSAMPLEEVVSARIVPEKILSYFAPGDERGKIVLTFNGEVGSVGQVTMGIGNVEVEGGYYQEVLNPVVSGRTITLDLTSKSRRKADMFANPELAGELKDFAIKIPNVKDTNGNLMLSSADGLIGSVALSIPYEELQQANISVEFTPAPGSQLNSGDQIEVYVTDYDQIQYSGVKFEYFNGYEMESATVAKAQINVEEESIGGVVSGTVLTFAVPEEVVNKKDLVLSFAGLVCLDGVDRSDLFTATYNKSLEVTASTPADGWSGAEYAENAVLTAQFNLAAQYPNMYVTYQIRDLNPLAGDDEIVKTQAQMFRNEDGSYTATNPSTIKLFAGHSYRVEFCAWASEEDTRYGSTASPLGTAFIYWTGTTPAPVYSTVQLLGITPENGFEISEPGDVTFTISFNAPVRLDAKIVYGQGMTFNFASVTPASGDVMVDGVQFANQWNLVADSATVAGFNDEMPLSITAFDIDGHRLIGNEGSKENSYFYFAYPVTLNYVALTATPADGAEIESLDQIVFEADGKELGFSYAEQISIYKNRNEFVCGMLVSGEELDPDDASAVNTKCFGKPYDFDSWKTLTLTEPGTYTIIVPAGAFLVGNQFDAKKTKRMEINLTIKGGDEPTPPATDKPALKLDPEEGNVPQLTTIHITFTGYSEVGVGGGKATIAKDGGAAENLPDAEYDWDGDLNMIYQPMGRTITDEGTYVISFPAGYFICDGKNGPAFTLTYTIGTADSIAKLLGVNANEPLTVYTLDGKQLPTAKLHSLKAGIYVINGKKVVLK